MYHVRDTGARVVQFGRPQCQHSGATFQPPVVADLGGRLGARNDRETNGQHGLQEKSGPEDLPGEETVNRGWRRTKGGRTGEKEDGALRPFNTK